MIYVISFISFLLVIIVYIAFVAGLAWIGSGLTALLLDALNYVPSVNLGFKTWFYGLIILSILFRGTFFRIQARFK